MFPETLIPKDLRNCVTPNLIYKEIDDEMIRLFVCTMILSVGLLASACGVEEKPVGASSLPTDQIKFENQTSNTYLITIPTLPDITLKPKESRTVALNAESGYENLRITFRRIEGFTGDEVYLRVYNGGSIVTLVEFVSTFGAIPQVMIKKVP
jgi:hypothetical protein